MALAVGILAIFYAVGFTILGYGIRIAWRSTEAANWPTALGTLSRLKLESSPSGDPDPAWCVAADYQYQVDGQPYAGSRIAFGYAGSGDRSVHEQLHARLAGASAVEVRYNPANPAVSVLSYGVHSSVRGVLGFGAMWLTFLIILTLTWWLTSGADQVLLDNLSVR